MTKKKIFCASLCILLFAMAGCSNYATSNSSNDQSSLISSTQSTTDVSIDSSMPTQSTTEESFESSPIESTAVTSTESSTLFNTEELTDLGHDNMDDTYKLVVKGKKIPIANHIKFNYEDNYAEIPLITLMRELGANVEWQNKTTAKITLGEKEYILDATKGSLTEAGKTFNVLVVAPGSKHGVFYRVVGDEFIVDSDSAKMFLINVIGLKMTIDYDNRIVSIS